MNSQFDLSIVVSSYNREHKVLQTVERLFESDFSGFQNIELIVIDDGSPHSVEDALAKIKQIPSVIDLRLVKQKNSGIGATRNRGYREAKSDIVIFLDDDILLKKDTIKNIFTAQQTGVGAVIFGSYPFVSHESESLRQFARKLYNYEDVTETPKFEEAHVITSGLLSVNKAKLAADDENFYKDDMTIPAAEEYEVVSRFYKLQIPIYHAKHIFADHNHHLELDWLAEQQYKYGLATAEAFTKNPEIIEMKEFGDMKRKLDFAGKSGAKNFVKTFLSSGVGRRLLHFSASALQKLFPNLNHDFLFGMLTSSYFWAGYREGTKRFAAQA